MSNEQLIGNRYRLLGKVEAGGMGEVYRALDRLTTNVVALKRVHTDDSSLDLVKQTYDTEDTRLALAQEFRTLSSLHHPGIINVLDFGFDADGRPFFTMQLVEDARDLYVAGQAESTEIKVDLLLEMLQALAYMHRRNIVHRDLKPGNVLVTAEGRVKLLDFGLSFGPKYTMTNVMDDVTVGTLQYMAPEVLQEEKATPPADLYAVGVMMYEMFAGRHPFAGSNIGSLLLQVISQAPNMSFVQAGAMESVIEKLLAKTPEERYQSAEETIKAICDATGPSCSQRKCRHSRKLFAGSAFCRTRDRTQSTKRGGGQSVRRQW